jgi:hypothetical protein
MGLPVRKEQWEADLDSIKDIAIGMRVRLERLEAELATEKAWARHCFERWDRHSIHRIPVGMVLDWDAERAEWEKARAKG